MGRKGQTPWNKGRHGVYKPEAIEQMRQSAWADIPTDKIVELYKQGNSCVIVAKLLGTNHSVVLRRIKPLGIVRDKGCGNRGRKLPIEHCKHISEGQKRLRNDPKEKKRLCMGKNNPFYGHKHKPETIEAMKKKLSILLSGANNPQWRGGLSYEPYSYDFKHYIRHHIYIRDNYQCTECGIIYEPNSGRLVAHHEDGDKNNHSLENLVTLCRRCHGITAMHSRWGKEVTKIK